MKKKHLSEALTWGEIADVYQEHYGGKPKILPVDMVFDAVEKLEDYYLDPKEGTIHKIIKN